MRTNVNNIFYILIWVMVLVTLVMNYQILVDFHLTISEFSSQFIQVVSQETSLLLNPINIIQEVTLDELLSLLK